MRIYNAVVKRYGHAVKNPLQLELLATHLFMIIKSEETGDREAACKSMQIVHSHIKELDQKIFLQKKKMTHAPGTTLAEWGSAIMERYRKAQAEENKAEEEAKITPQHAEMNVLIQESYALWKKNRTL